MNAQAEVNVLVLTSANAKLAGWAVPVQKVSVLDSLTVGLVPGEQAVDGVTLPEDVLLVQGRPRMWRAVLIGSTTSVLL